MRVTLVTGVRHNEQPGDLEAGEGADVTGGEATAASYKYGKDTLSGQTVFLRSLIVWQTPL